jgi:two-component system cell cycle sensor histidine kinase/response regulator CckA
VVLNLAINARDAMPDGGVLTIETLNAEVGEREGAGVPPGSYAVLRVRDTGLGMDPETMSHVFEPFFTTKEKGKGTGLGLATVHGIVEQSGGYVRAESALGLGSTLTVWLPRSAGRAPAVGETARAPEAGRSLRGSETILIVEDDDTIRSLIRDALDLYGYTALAACHGAEALELCKRYGRRIDLVVTDVVMPQMGGVEFVRRLGALSPTPASLDPPPRILFMSGHTDDVILRDDVREARTAFLQKPFTPTALVGKVREVLDGERFPSPSAE